MDDYKLIKNLYGEEMLHLCKKLFPTILDIHGLLPSILKTKFYPSKTLIKDIISENKIEDFRDYIYSQVDLKRKKIIGNKHPKKLLREAGYTLYECKTEEDIQKFKKYYHKGEELCTFNGGRLEYNYVFFIVRDDALHLDRNLFPNPERDDNYGTSVISIQFFKGKINTVSLKNRYNDTVEDADATYSNNLDLIVSGLTDSFEKYYHLKTETDEKISFCLDKYIEVDNTFYKYNYKINDTYYCPNNIIIKDGKVICYEEKERYIVFDYFILDNKEKTIKIIDDKITDSFINDFNNIEKININKINNYRIINIVFENNQEAKIVLNENNEMIEYKNNNILSIDNKFLYYNKTLLNLDLENVIEIENDFLALNNSLENINIPNIKNIGNWCLCNNDTLTILNAPNMEEVGIGFFLRNNSVKVLQAPSLRNTGMLFFNKNTSFEYIDISEDINKEFGFLKKYSENKEKDKVLCKIS